MNEREIEKLRSRYDERLAQYGYSPQTLGWTKPKHRLRYKVLLDYWRLQETPGLEILDFGCGFGDLYGYAKSQGLDIRYHGIDVNPKLIEVAREVYPDAEFSLAASDGSLQRSYDVILASGAHNHRIDDNERYIDASFSEFFQRARRGFAVNFLSSRVNHRGPDNYYASPEDVLGRALRYSSRVLLRHDYMPFEFTIFVDKADDFKEEYTVFRDFERWCDKENHEDDRSG